MSGLIFLPRILPPAEDRASHMARVADGTQLLPDALDIWAYPLIQPLARTLFGMWLWRHRGEGVSPRDP